MFVVFDLISYQTILTIYSQINNYFKQLFVNVIILLICNIYILQLINKSLIFLLSFWNIHFKSVLKYSTHRLSLLAIKMRLFHWNARWSIIVLAKVQAQSL